MAIVKLEARNASATINYRASLNCIITMINETNPWSIIIILESEENVPLAVSVQVIRWELFANVT